MLPRGSANAPLLRGMKPREASAIAASISTVSTRSMARLCSSVCVVSPVPMPITAAEHARGHLVRIEFHPYADHQQDRAAHRRRPQENPSLTKKAEKQKPKR